MRVLLLAVLVLTCCFASVWAVAPGWDVAQVKLTAGDAQSFDLFGRGMALSSDGTTLVVGARYEDGGAGDPVNDAGAAYVNRLLTPGNGTWTQVAKLTAEDAGAIDLFGDSVAVSSDGTTVAVGAYGEDGGPGGSMADAGAVYVYRLLSPGSGTWTQVAKLTADDAQAGDEFGYSIAMSGDGNTVVIGARYEDGGPGDPLNSAGAAYVFRLLAPGSGTWTQIAKLVANDAQDYDYFGHSVAVSGDGNIVVVGAPDEDGGPGDPVPGVGAAYVFRSGTWAQEAKLASDDPHNSNYFGYSVAISSDSTTIVIGARYHPAAANNGGAACVFRESIPGNGSWAQIDDLTADDAQDNDEFGNSVAVSGDGTTIVVGALFEDGGPGDPLSNAGAAYVFHEPSPGNGTWSQAAKLTADDAQADDRFGISVAVSSDGTTVMLGAYQEDGGPGDPLSNAGAVYLLSGAACPPGEASDGNASEMCVPCSVGSSVLGKPCSCDDGYYIDGTQCVACPQFATRSILAADSPAGCLCDQGYYNDGAICLACPVSTLVFDSPIGAVDASECVLCPPGHRPNGRECEQVNCNSGESFNENDLTCEPCPILTTSNAGDNVCRPDCIAILAIIVPSGLAVLGAVVFVLHKRRRLVNTVATDDGVDKLST